MVYSIQFPNRQNGANNAKLSKNVPERPSEYVVKSGDTITKLAREKEITVEQYKALAGLTSDNLAKGQKLNLKTDKVPKGKGIITLASNYKMDFDLFCKLNNIPKPCKEYKAGADEKFYVIPNSETKPKEKKQAAKRTEENSQKSAVQQPLKEPEPTASTFQTPSSASSVQVNSSASKEESKIVYTPGNGRKKWTAGELRNSIMAGAKKSKEYTNIKDPKIVRPLPNVDENGRIQTISEIRYPTVSSGTLKGKVVILNSGHGGYNPNTGFFDSGTVSVVKNAEGNDMPIEEWCVAQSYVNELSSKLQEKGATVIFVQGPVRPKAMAADQFIENLILGKRGSKEIKDTMKNTKKSDMLLLSIHVESAAETPVDPKRSIRIKQGDAKDYVFAKNVSDQVSKHIKILSPKLTTDNLYVVRATGSEIPGALLEIGNIYNPTIRNSLLSSMDRGKYTDALAAAIEDTMVPVKKKK